MTSEQTFLDAVGKLLIRPEYDLTVSDRCTLLIEIKTLFRQVAGDPLKLADELAAAVSDYEGNEDISSWRNTLHALDRYLSARGKKEI